MWTLELLGLGGRDNVRGCLHNLSWCTPEVVNGQSATQLQTFCTEGYTALNRSCSVSEYSRGQRRAASVLLSFSLSPSFLCSSFVLSLFLSLPLSCLSFSFPLFSCPIFFSCLHLFSHLFLRLVFSPLFFFL